MFCGNNKSLSANAQKNKVVKERRKPRVIVSYITASRTGQGFRTQPTSAEDRDFDTASYEIRVNVGKAPLVYLEFFICGNDISISILCQPYFAR